MKKACFLLTFLILITIKINAQMSYQNDNKVFNNSKKNFEYKTISYSNISNDSKIFTNDNDNSARRRKSRRSSSSGDGGLYINVGLGYNLGMGTQNMEEFVDKETDLYGITSTTQVPFSLGKGLDLKLAAGYMVNGNVGIELDLYYLLGGKTTATEKEPFNTTKTKVTETSLKASMININPTVVISSGLDGINPYAKFGLNLGIGSFNKEIVVTADTNNSSTKIQFSGSAAFGVNAALGAVFTISDNISFFAEFNVLNMSYAPEKSEIIEYTLQGKDKLADIPEALRITNYADGIVDVATPEPNASPIKLKQYYTFSSFGLNVGVKFNF